MAPGDSDGAQNLGNVSAHLIGIAMLHGATVWPGFDVDARELNDLTVRRVSSTNSKHDGQGRTMAAYSLLPRGR